MAELHGVCFRYGNCGYSRCSRWPPPLKRSEQVTEKWRRQMNLVKVWRNQVLTTSSSCSNSPEVKVIVY